MRRRLSTAALACLLGLGSAAAGASEADQPNRFEFPRSEPPAHEPEAAVPVHPQPLATDAVALPRPATVQARLNALAAEHRAHADTAASGVIAAGPDASRKLTAELSALSHGASQHAELGIAVRRVDTGADVFSFHAEKELNPASNHKLLTAVAAVELLGADYRYETSVAIAGDALVLIGTGDPTLQVPQLDALAQRVADAELDLSKVRRIIADNSAFSARRFGPGYEASGPAWSYLAPSGALSLQFNTVTVTARAQRGDTSPRVVVSPASEHIIVDNNTRLGSRTRLSVSTRHDGEHTVVDVRGTVAVGAPQTERRRIADPTRFTAATFARLLALKTGRSPLPVSVMATPAGATPIASHRSAPLPEVLWEALGFSNNFTSEQVLRTLGRHFSGTPGDWTNGNAALRQFWSAIGRNNDELSFENASGYSRLGRMTADALVALLAMTQRPDSPAAALVDILPACGKQGTMRRRLRRAKGRVRAKTGTLNGASALSGLATSRDGQRAYSFSILVNGPLLARQSRRLQDRVVMALLSDLD